MLLILSILLNINVIISCQYYYFISFYLFIYLLIYLFVVVHITMIFVWVFLWRVCFPSSTCFFFFFLLMIYISWMRCLYMLRIIFLLLLLFISSSSSSLSFYFFSTLLAIGREFSEWIRAAWPTPNHWLLWVSHRVSFSLFFVSYTLVPIIEGLIPSFIFVIWHHLIMMPRRLKI